MGSKLDQLGPRPRLVGGVCCQFCRWFETADCPVKTASPWSRWGNWCNVYEPNQEIAEAQELVADGGKHRCRVNG